jgi:hypothetical protein
MHTYIHRSYLYSPISLEYPNGAPKVPSFNKSIQVDVTQAYALLTPRLNAPVGVILGSRMPDMCTFSFKLDAEW